MRAGMENELRPLPPEARVGPPPLPAATGETPVFTGSGGEYFRIWIVNLCLTLVTLGFYIPWARVRTRRYFYRNTILGGASFDYLADPKRLLVGYLIVGALFFVYVLGDLISIWVTLGALLVFFLAFPYIRYKSLRFFARNSAWQNVRLRFHGTLGEAYRIYLGMMLLVPLTLGLIYPLVAHRGSQYLFGNLSFGQARGQFTAGCGRFYAIYLGAAGIFLAAVGVFIAVIAAAAFYSFSKIETPKTEDAVLVEVAEDFVSEKAPVTDEEAERPTAKPREVFKDLNKEGAEIQRAEDDLEPDLSPLIALGALAFYFVPIAVFLGAGVLLRNHCWNNFHVSVPATADQPEAKVTFRSRMKVFTFLGIQLGNLLLILLTLGIYLPWAKVRIHRYRLRCLEVHGLAGLGGVLADPDAEQNAVGDSASDLFDLEFGL
jgi:uncharacterized membrane protein YjgN (DUF898 family)